MTPYDKPRSSFASLDDDTLKNIFSFMPKGYHLILALVCRAWSQVPVPDKVTYYKHVLASVPLLQCTDPMRLAIESPQSVYRHATYEVFLYYQTCLGISIETIVRTPKVSEGVKHRICTFETYALLYKLVAGQVNREKLCVDLASIPQEEHPRVFAWMKKVSCRMLQFEQFMEFRLDHPFTCSRELVDQYVVTKPWNKYSGICSEWYRAMLYAYGWGGVIVCDEFDSFMLKQLLVHMLYVERDPEVYGRLLQLMGGQVTIREADFGFVLERTKQNVYYVVQHVINAAASVGGISLNLGFNICPSRLSCAQPSTDWPGPEPLTPLEQFFLIRSPDAYARHGSPRSVGALLGALYWGNLTFLKRTKFAVRPFWMKVAVSRGHLEIVKWLTGKGLPLSGPYLLPPHDTKLLRWLVKKGCRSFAGLNKLPPGMLQLLHEAGLVEVNKKEDLKSLGLTGIGKSKDTATWRFFDHLVRRNLIYPSLIYDLVIENGIAYTYIEQWSEAGYLDKLEDLLKKAPACAAISLRERTQPMIERVPKQAPLEVMDIKPPVPVTKFVSSALAEARERVLARPEGTDPLHLATFMITSRRAHEVSEYVYRVMRKLETILTDDPQYYSS